MEGDHLISPELARRLVVNHYLNVVLVDDVVTPEFDEETVILGHDGIVESLVWPARYLPEGDRKKVVGEALTIFKLSASAGVALAQQLDSGEIIAPINRILPHHRMYYLSTGLLPWLEIDTPADLARAHQVYQSVEAT
jgi:choline kinase